MLCCQVLFAYPPEKELPLNYQDLLSFCFPGGLKVWYFLTITFYFVFFSFFQRILLYIYYFQTMIFFLFVWYHFLLFFTLFFSTNFFFW